MTAAARRTSRSAQDPRAGAAPRWVVLDAQGNAPRLSTGNEWEPIVDNERAFAAALDSIAHARRTVFLSQLLFEPDLQAEYPDSDEESADAARRRGHGRIAEALREAAARGAHLRIVLNENAAVPDHVDELRAYLDDASRVALRAGRRNPGVMHAKLLLVDDEEAMLIGSPFQQHYWDTRHHLAHDQRRGNGRRPLHDVSLRLRGPVVQDVRREFARIWRNSTGDAEPRRIVEPLHGRNDAADGAAGADEGGRDGGRDGWGGRGNGRGESGHHHHHQEDPPREVRDAEAEGGGCSGLVSGPAHALQVVVTAPALGRSPYLPGGPQTEPAPPKSLVTLAARLADKVATAVSERAGHARFALHQEGERSVFQAYERALRNARGFVYAENQYFTNAPLAGLIDKALRESPELQVILLLNENMDIPGYDRAQLALLKPLLADHGDRLGVFSAWSTNAARSVDGLRGIRHVYVHSKTTIVDDAWATVGSANWDGASLSGAQELGLGDVVNEELSVVLYDGVDGAPHTGTAARLRVDLWSEMLGVPPARLQTPPPGGWLALWNEVAESNMRRLRGREEHLQGFVLPYAPELPDEGLDVQ